MRRSFSSARSFDLAKVPESAFGTELEGLRAYDRNSKRLERVLGYTSSSWEDGVSYRGYAFHGDVARAEVDVATEWIELDIDYEMPPAPSLSGPAPASPPEGKFMVKLTGATP